MCIELIFILLFCYLYSKHRWHNAWVLLLVPRMERGNWHYCYCAEWLYLFILSSGIACKTLSQMCGRLYFPIFLLRVGLFTLMYMDSFMVLAKLFSSLPIILKFSIVVSWPLLSWCAKIEDGDFKCSLNLSPNVLILRYTPPHSQSSHNCSCKWYLFLAIASLSFSDTRTFLSVCPSLKCTASPCFSHMFFILSHMPCV